MTRAVKVVLGWIGCLALAGCHDEVAGERLQSAAPKASAVRCEGCHVREAAQWGGSRHHASFTNADFQRSFAREPEEFCRGCHAPATRDTEADPAEAEERGVSCVDCHGDVSSVRTGPGPEVKAPHALARVDDFGTRACASCHEFAFPEGTRQPSGAMMQTTMREHQASEHAGTDCAGCHLPRTTNGVDHSLASTRSDAAWRAALSVVAASTSDGVSFELTPHDVGHALPTGDLFRRLRLRAELRDGVDTVASAQRYLGRHFEPMRRPDGTYNRAHDWPTPDDRLRGPATVVLELNEGAASGTEIVWWVDYERVDNRDPVHPERSAIASTVSIANGRLAPFKTLPP